MGRRDRARADHVGALTGFCSARSRCNAARTLRVCGMSEMGRTRIGLLRTYVPRQRLIPAGTRPAPGMSQQPSIYHGASTQTLVGHYGCRRTSVASAFWLFFAASMATPVIMHAKAMLAPTINSVIKMIMRSVNCDACASFVRPRPHAATTAKGPFISCLMR